MSLHLILSEDQKNLSANVRNNKYTEGMKRRINCSYTWITRIESKSKDGHNLRCFSISDTENHVSETRFTILELARWLRSAPSISTSDQIQLVSFYGTQSKQ